jgi:hypothetical protein
MQQYRFIAVLMDNKKDAEGHMQKVRAELFCSAATFTLTHYDITASAWG